MSNVDELGKLGALQQAGTSRGPEFAAEEARLLDELLASADLGIHTTPEVQPGYEMGDTEEAPEQGQAHLAPAPQKPEDGADTVSPSAYGPPEPPGSTFPDTTTTPSAADEAGSFESLHQGGTDEGSEVTGEETQQPEEVRASFDLDAPEIGSDDRISDAETLDDVARAGLALAPQHFEEAVSPFAYGASLVTTVADTTSSSEGEPGTNLALHEDRTDEGTELAGEETKQSDETPASFDISSPESSEFRSDSQLSGDEITDEKGQAGMVAAPQQPEEEVASPFAYIPSLGSTFTIVTTESEDDEPVVPDSLHKDETSEPEDLVTVEVGTHDQPSASAELSSPAIYELPSDDQIGEAETPADQGHSTLTLAPQQPEEDVVRVSPFAYRTFGSREQTSTDSATPIEDDEDGTVETLHHDGTEDVTEPAAEVAEQSDELPVSAELTLSDAPETDAEISDAETPDDQGQPDLALAPQQPEEDVVRVSPFAYGPPTPPEPTFTNTTTPIEDDEDGTVETLHHDGTEDVTEPAAEVAEQSDELPVSAELTVSDAPEADAEISDAETPDDQGQPDLALTPQQPEEEVVRVSPFAYRTFGSREQTSTDSATPIENDEDRTVEILHHDATEEVTESAAEVAEQPEEVPVSAELSSPDEPELESDDQTADSETPADQEPTEVASVREQPEETVARVSRFSYSPPTWGPTITAVTAPSEDDEPQALETAHQDGTDEADESAVEEAQQAEETAASARLDTPATPEERSDYETGDAETLEDQVQVDLAPAPKENEQETVTVSTTAHLAPTPASAPLTETMLGETRSRRRLRTSRTIMAVLAVVFLLTTLGAGFVALKQNSSARQWRQDDQKAVTLNHVLSSGYGTLTKDLASDHATIASLSSQTSRLSAQVKSLQTQLSSSSKTKVKTPGRGLLVELTAEAGTVSSGLSTCVGDMNSLTAEISHDLANPSYKDPHLQSNTQSADQVCATARQDNQHLQSTLSAAA